MKLITRPNLLRVILACIAVGMLVLLDAIWFQSLTDEASGKILVTLAIVAAACGLAYAVISDMGAVGKQENDKYLD